VEAAISTSRPRVTGDREREIFLATLDLLGEAGYDKLTLDAVAARAKASKATLYRRWPSKGELVLDALGCLESTAPDLPDTGSLRADLLELGRATGWLEPARAHVLCGLMTALHRDGDLRDALGRRFLDPRNDTMRALLVRARDRGELRPDVDLDLICQVVPAMILYQLSMRTEGVLPPDHLVRLLDQVLLPAVVRRTS
jgi:AcrR family transcriptional regulator